ncbi:alpha/beta hydrolase [Phenylobacterium sp.]|uniref:alpha/beta fold hydrolase n=1 Tax=Phenylobacterium sp. TaxID=1871053 RepID=UPI00121B216A|nr:alpha/beta hydrolase [Phenylobacterium sp.]THD59057.1 MAG: alpha/beta hydrolase [Phenylobacterium sp.]
MIHFRPFLLAMVLSVAVTWSTTATAAHLHYGWQKVDGLNLFYREGGPSDAPTIVFLHGNPAYSIQYEEVMQDLVAGGRLHVIAMDYPSFGYSDAPDHKAWAYTFDHLAETVSHFLAARGLSRYALFMQDYGVPIGFRLMQANPEVVTAVMVQNGAIHLDGFPQAQDPQGELRRHWRSRNADLDRRRAEYALHRPYPGATNWDESANLSPDVVLLNNASEQRPGVIEGRNDLWANYGTNVEQYPAWQALLRGLKVPVLVAWGSQDDFFTTLGALANLRDAPQAEVHILDTVHFATLEAPDAIAVLIATFAHAHDLR